MSKGIDIAVPISQLLSKRIKANGLSYALRYIYPREYNNWKSTSQYEISMLHSEGLAVGLIFEYAGSKSEIQHDGARDGNLAYRALKELGAPHGLVVYFGVDFDAQESDLNSVEAYLKEAQSQLYSQYEVGVYGSYRVVEAMLARGVVKHAWQTVAWSYGQIAKNIDLLQYSLSNTSAFNTSVDFDETYGNEIFWLSNRGVGSVEHIQPAPLVIKEGDTGEHVKEIQGYLGFPPNERDGIFGKQTKDAVIAFQQANHLVVDGVVGEITLTTLEKHPVPLRQTPGAKQQPAPSKPPQSQPTQSKPVSQPSAPTTEQQLQSLTNRVSNIESSISSLSILKDVPDWAVDAVNWGIAKGLFTNKVGTTDFYRMVTTLYTLSVKGNIKV